ncbi:MAG TPA: hypothetical protein VFZ65_23905 [Planctomycetota bacterium]|nr:hypothetical protein [Planctomycetota bacterium]
MHPSRTLCRVLAVAALCTAVAAQKPKFTPAPSVPFWPGYGRDPGHTAQTTTGTQPLNHILWQTPVDLQPQYSGTSLLIHYGSPLITAGWLVIVTVKTGVSGDFQLECRHPVTGSLIWTQTTDYILPPHNWVPSCGSTITPQNKIATPAAGGTILLREQADLPASAVTRIAFYGLANYQANPGLFDTNVRISTPITSDQQGNLFFGFRVSGTGTGLTSGIARIDVNGNGTWVSAATAANDSSIRKVVYNCAPAITSDGASLYIGVNSSNNSGGSAGYLLKLNSTTLAQQGRVRLKDVASPATDAYLYDDGTASPTIGPDGDVYFGVLENPFGSNNLRGWMRHFDGTLAVSKLPSAFGWDDTSAIVPRSMVPQYTGPSSYLILTKYNNYGGGAGGNGLNKLGVFDPNTPMVDPVSGATVMNVVIEVLGPTPDPTIPGGVREWCINTAAIDIPGQSAIVNCEDGKAYRWHFPSNSLTETVTLTSGIGEAYTPTIVGPTGISYAMNNATLYALGR